MATQRFSLDLELSRLAAAQQTIMNFNSFSKIGNSYIAANEDGIFRLNRCESADGDDIDAYFELIKTDLGTRGQKRFNSIYVGYWSEGSLSFKITVDDVFVRTFVLPPVRSSKQHGNRIPLSMELDGAYLQIEIGNVDGCDFSIDFLDLDVSFLGLKPIGTSL